MPVSRPLKKYIPGFNQLPFGYIIGKVTLTDVIRIGTGALFNTSNVNVYKLTEQEKAFGNYSPGRFAFVLENAMAFKLPGGSLRPINAMGIR